MSHNHPPSQNSPPSHIHPLDREQRRQLGKTESINPQGKKTVTRRKQQHSSKSIILIKRMPRGLTTQTHLLKWPSHHQTIQIAPQGPRPQKVRKHLQKCHPRRPKSLHPQQSNPRAHPLLKLGKPHLRTFLKKPTKLLRNKRRIKKNRNEQIQRNKTPKKKKPGRPTLPEGQCAGVAHVLRVLKHGDSSNRVARVPSPACMWCSHSCARNQLCG